MFKVNPINKSEDVIPESELSCKSKSVQGKKLGGPCRFLFLFILKEEIENFIRDLLDS